MNPKTKQVFYKMKNFLIFKLVDAQGILKKYVLNLKIFNIKKLSLWWFNVFINLVYGSSSWKVKNCIIVIGGNVDEDC